MSTIGRPAGLAPKPQTTMVDPTPAPTPAVPSPTIAEVPVPNAVERQAQPDEPMDDTDELPGLGIGNPCALAMPSSPMMSMTAPTKETDAP